MTVKRVARAEVVAVGTCAGNNQTFFELATRSARAVDLTPTCSFASLAQSGNYTILPFDVRYDG